MKNKIAIASAAFLAASGASQAEIVINDFLSFEGFVDMSYAHYDGEIDNNVANESDNSFAIDQVEINWLFDFDPVTAQIDFDYEDNDEDTVEVEQAFVNYDLGNGGTITAGRYDSMLGFEAFEPTGLYQYSFAYGLPSFTGDLLDGLGGGIGGDDVSAISAALFPVGPRQSQGVKYTYETDTSFFGISLQDGVSNYEGRLGGDNDKDGTGFDGGGYGVEVAGSVILADGVTWFLGGFYEDGDGYNTTNINTGDTEAYAINSYVTFETGAWIFAAEVTYGENEWDQGTTGTLPWDLDINSLNALLMANFAYSDQGSITGRVSYVDSELEADTVPGDVTFEYLKYTLAHSWAFTDNLLLVTEVSYLDGEIDDSTGTTGFNEDFDELLAAVELIFSF